MNLITIKDFVKNNAGKEFCFKYSLGRNKVEKFYGVIKNTYDYIFTVENVNNKETKSYTYSDLVTKTLKIYKKV